ncbi:MAG: hypothetical protein AAF485_04990 [Chloroflexota bacterium]
MTPTLYGRWQSRFLLLATVGSLVTTFFAWLYQTPASSFSILGYVLLLGFLWDILYQYLQTYRWDEDWPAIFQLFTGLVEGLLVWALIAYVPWHTFGLSHLPGVSKATLNHFISHYSTVWLFVFLGTQGPLRVLFPRWRFFGGQWL